MVRNLVSKYRLAHAVIWILTGQRIQTGSIDISIQVTVAYTGKPDHTDQPCEFPGPYNMCILKRQIHLLHPYEQPLNSFEGKQVS